MPHHHMQHVQNVGPSIFACNENSAYVMPHVTACTVTSCMHHAAHASRQVGRPCVNLACQKLLLHTLFMPAKLYLLKFTASYFSTLNMKTANQNVLKMILISMHNKNKADCNENFRICAEKSIGPLYKW